MIDFRRGGVAVSRMRPALVVEGQIRAELGVRLGHGLVALELAADEQEQSAGSRCDSHSEPPIHLKRAVT